MSSEANPITACGNCCGGSWVVAASIAGIVIGALGVAGVMGIHSVSVGSLVTSALSGNIVQIVVSILGLTGTASAGVVSGVALGSSILMFMAGSAKCGQGCKEGYEALTTED